MYEIRLVTSKQMQKTRRRRRHRREEFVQCYKNVDDEVEPDNEDDDNDNDENDVNGRRKTMAKTGN